MALTAPRVFFGVHSFTPYNRSTGLFYGIVKVLGGSSLSLGGEIIELNGGSSKYSWAAEDGVIDAEMSLKPKEYPDFLFELFLGKAPTANSAETTGNITTAANKYGTSIINASNGLDAVEVTSGDSADLKFGKYVIKATGAQAFDVYFSSDADISRGTDGSYVNDALKITSAPLSVASADAVMADWGLTFSKVGTPAFTVGDTATFSVRPVNSKSMTVTVGATSDSFPEFGAILMAQKRGNEEMLELDCFRCKGSGGLNIGLEEKAFSEADIKAKLLYDSTLDGVFAVRHVSPS
jgi:hypothetical protein